MKTKLFILAIMLFSTFPLIAGYFEEYRCDFTVDGIHYRYETETTVAVTFKYYLDCYVPDGEYCSGDEWQNDYSGSIVIPESVTYNGITYNVVAITDGAFCNSSELTSVTIPQCITTIGTGLFGQCPNLTSIIIEDTHPFYYSKGICIINKRTKQLVCGSENSIIPTDGSVKTIGRSAFEGCSGLTSITIPSSITTIGEDAFYLCDGLLQTNYTGDIASWCAITFENYQANPSHQSHNLYLNDVEIKDAIIPDGVDEIGDYAFYSCSALTSVSISNSVTAIGASAFSGCSALEKVNYAGTLQSWCTISMGSNPLNNGADFYLDDVKVTDVRINFNPNDKFKGCTSLQTIHFLLTVSSINDNAFSNCTNLQSISMDGVSSIGKNAFGGCTSLKSIILPRLISSIGEGAFGGCTSLTNVTIKRITPPTIGSHAFPASTKVIVPCGSTEAYWANAEWAKYLNYEEAFLFDWSAVSHNEEYGTVLVAQSPTCEDNTATFVAIPASGYKFKTWHDGNTDNPRTVAITNDINYKAHFIDQNDTTDGAITVRFQKPAHWSNVYLYAWNGELPNVINYLGTWPGKQLSQSNEDGWYSYTFDPSLVSVNFIFNSGSVGIQTSDLFTFESVCYIWDDNINDGVQVDCPIIEDVIHVSNVTLNKYFLHLNISQSYQLTATITPSDADNPAISWSSSNPEVATISETGLIETVAQGYTTITVTTADGGFTASCEVYVSVPVESITFDQTALTLVPNKAQQLTATILPENASNKNYTWQSSNENVAIVVKNGLVVALAEGATTITAITEDGGLTATCAVTVTTVSGILLDKTSLELSVGDVAQLTETIIATEASYQLVNWATSDANVATVENGLVTAVGAGVAAIGVATVDGGFVATCAVVVKDSGTTEVQQVAANPSGVQKVLVDGVLYIVKPNGEKYLVDGRKVE